MPRVRCARCGDKFMRHLPRHTLCTGCWKWSRENHEAAGLESQATTLLREARAKAQGGGVRVPARVLQDALRAIEGGMAPGETSKVRMGALNEIRSAIKASRTTNPSVGVIVPTIVADQVLRFLSGAIDPSQKARTRVRLTNELRSILEGWR